MKLAVVIVHYNSSTDLENCLTSLAACAPAADHRVVVVDNASVDEGLDQVHRNHPECLWIFNKENVGYSRGCNRGMAQVQAEYYLVLNPDIVVQPGALDRLLDFADAHPRAGLVGPQLLNTDGSIQDSCRRFYTLKTLLLRRTFLGRIFPNSLTVRRHLMQDFDHRSNRPVDWLLGGCLLVRSSAVARTGPMDERFFLYFEDVDWCYRMWQAGFEVLPPSRGIDGIYPPPIANDGIMLDEQDAGASEYTLQHIRRFIFEGLNAYDQSELKSMGIKSGSMT